MGFRLVELQVHGDDRGSLIALEGGGNVPFDIKRVYYVYGTGANICRGKHAHRNLRQLAVVVHGSCRFLLDDGVERNSVTLSSPMQGLLIEGLVWREMHDFSPDCVLMVLADGHYNEKDYVRDYEEFKKLARGSEA